MKLINYLLSFLILILAVASAVGSFFLFEKREQLVKGWEKMAQAMTLTATELDKGSGTEIAKELSADKLSHKNYATLDANLPKLQEQAGKIIKERNDLSAAVKKIADIVEMENVAALDDFQKLASYSNNKNKVVTFIEEMKQRQDNTLRLIASTAKKVGVNISVENLKGSEYNSEFNKFGSKLGIIQSKLNVYQGNIAKIASIVGAPKPNFSDSQYRSANNVASHVVKLNSKYKSTIAALNSEKKKVASLQNTIKSKEGKIVRLDSTISTKNREVQRLRELLGGGQKKGVTIEDAWMPGSPQSRSAVQGKIIDVNNKYGFVVVDLGKNTIVEQKIGKKFNKVDPQIVSNVDMTVARGLDSGKGEYVGKIKLVKVEKNCSIANLIPGSNNGQRLRIGDTVYFSTAQIEQMMRRK